MSLGIVELSTQYNSENARWQAVSERDPRADGQFVFAVSTTGIYCRPSCSSRAALRKNVTFFDDAAQAESAGFRACKRCKPRDEGKNREPRRDGGRGLSHDRGGRGAADT